MGKHETIHLHDVPSTNGQDLFVHTVHAPKPGTKIPEREKKETEKEKRRMEMVTVAVDIDRIWYSLRTEHATRRRAELKSPRYHDLRIDVALGGNGKEAQAGVTNR